MIDRRNFLRLGALFVPAALVEPRRVYSFCGGWQGPLYSTRMPVAEFIRMSIERSIRDSGKVPWSNEPFPIISGLLRARLEGIVIKGTIAI